MEQASDMHLPTMHSEEPPLATILRSSPELHAFLTCMSAENKAKTLQTHAYSISFSLAVVKI